MLRELSVAEQRYQALLAVIEDGRADHRGGGEGRGEPAGAALVAVVVCQRWPGGVDGPVAECRPDHASEWEAMRSVAQKLGIGTTETVRKSVRRAEVDAGARPGVTSDESAELRRLKAEVPYPRRIGQPSTETGHRLHPSRGATGPGPAPPPVPSPSGASFAHGRPLQKLEMGSLRCCENAVLSSASADCI